MKRVKTTLLVSVALIFVTAACGKAKPSSDLSRLLGGTLRVEAPEVDEGVLLAADPNPASLDPQREFTPIAWEILRCCLARTLLTHPGAPANRGGSELRPDLATKIPDVSADGLTWTFHIRHGMHYGPPLRTVEVTAPDFVRALKRMAKVGKEQDGGGGYLYQNIQGYHDYEEGKTQSITGLEAPDRYTFVVRLIRPEGDLGYRFAIPGTAPIPPSPTDPAAEFGVATGHDASYGRFLVSSGPYMLEGSEALTPSAPPDAQRPAAGLVLGKSLTLVRNPSWKRETDPLRPAYVDRIEFTLTDSSIDEGALKELGADLDQNKIDLAMIAARPPQAPPEQIRRYQADPTLGRVEFDKRDSIRFASIRITEPPFDDVHVRRAINAIIDRPKLVEIQGGALLGDVTGHIVIDSLEANALSSYDPYGAETAQARLDRAKAEMRGSRYDSDRDGLCDAAACRTAKGLHPDIPNAGATLKFLRDAAARIGIKLTFDVVDFGKFFERLSDPASHWGIACCPAWGKDVLNPSTFFTPLFGSAAIGGGSSNFSLVGASKVQLRSWRAPIGEVPSVDARMQQCLEAVGGRQLSCWVALDQYLMEDVVPWIPFLAESHIQVIPARVLRYSFDQLTTLPALVQIAVKH